MCIHFRKLHACFILGPSLSLETLRLEGLDHLTGERRGCGDRVGTNTPVSYLFFKYLLFSDCVPGNVISTCANSLSPHYKPTEYVLLSYFSFYRQGTWRIEVLRNFPQITEVVRIWTQAVCSRVCASSHLTRGPLRELRRQKSGWWEEPQADGVWLSMSDCDLTISSAYTQKELHGKVADFSSLEVCKEKADRPCVVRVSRMSSQMGKA